MGKMGALVANDLSASRRAPINRDMLLELVVAPVWEDKRIGKQVDSKSIALHRVAGSSPVSSAFLVSSKFFLRCLLR